jgi:S1-C subfamily serine protease
MGTRLEVYHGGKAHAAQVAGVDVANDLAVLKVEGAFPSVRLRPSSGVAIGAEVSTVGFPNLALQGAAPKASKGIINSLKGLQDDPRYFQISAEINPGSSGGALVDTEGSVVGVVTAMLDAAVSASVTGALPQNVNYAVKSSYLLTLLESMPEVQAAQAATKYSTASNAQEAIALLEKATVLVVVY